MLEDIRNSCLKELPLEYILRYPKFPDKRYGFIYIMEYGDYVKIGSTNDLRRRVNQHRHMVIDYNNNSLGRIIVSVSHLNYKANEKLIHSKLKSFRRCNTELFELSIDDVYDLLLEIDLTFDI